MKEDLMWRYDWQTLQHDFKIPPKSRAQANVALIRSSNASEKACMVASRLNADCLYLQRHHGLYFEQGDYERLGRFSVHMGDNNNSSQLRSETARQRDLLDLEDCVVKIRESNLEMFRICALDESDESYSLDERFGLADSTDGDEVRALSSTDESASAAGSQLSIEAEIQIARHRGSTAMARLTPHDEGIAQPVTLSTYQSDDVALVPRNLSGLQGQRGTLQSAMATTFEAVGKAMPASSTNTPDPTAVMATAGIVVGATSLDAVATAINGYGTRKAAHRSARVAEDNARYANTLRDFSSAEHV